MNCEMIINFLILLTSGFGIIFNDKIFHLHYFKINEKTNTCSSRQK